MRVGYYAANLEAAPQFAPLEGYVEARVAIIGGGFAGLNTARSLADRGVHDVVLLDGEAVGFGASGRNGGFVFGGYSLGEAALLRRVGRAHARRLFARSVAAVDLIRARIVRHSIACDLVDAGVIWANWFRDASVLRQRQALLADAYDVHWSWLDRAALRERLVTERYSAGLFERNAMHLQPLKYALGLAGSLQADGVAIHEYSPARRLTRAGPTWVVTTPAGQLRAQHVVLACGGYLAGLVPRIDHAVLPIATYVVATEPLGAQLRTLLRTDAAVYDTRFAFDYYRALPDTRLLWGGRISIRDRSADAVQRLLRKDIARVYPQLAGIGIDFAWSGLMSYARHEMPQIGGDGSGLWWAQAFGGHGLAPTTVAGEVLAAAIADADTAWQDFAPFGLERTWRPLGTLAAQAQYWHLEARDAWRAWRDDHHP